jgi:hypothetical protein
MTVINTNFKTPSGKAVTVNLTIQNHRVSGSATINGQAYGVNGYATVQGRQILKLANAPYLPISGSLYSQIESACKAQFVSQMTPLQIAEGRMAEAQAKYNRLFAQGYDNVAIINARNEWEQATAEYNKIK